MIFLPGSVAGSIQTLGIQGDFEVFQTSIYGVSSTVSSWLALSGFGTVPNSANWQIYKPNTGEFLPTTQTDFRYGYLSGGNPSLDASLEPLSARLLVSVLGGSYFSKNVVPLKPYESPLDIPNLQLWLDASDENTVIKQSLTTDDWFWNFNGSGDRLRLTHQPSLNILSGNFTVECFINVKQFPSSFTVIIGQWRQSTGFGGYTFGFNNLGQLFCTFGAFSESASLISTTTKTLSVGVTSHIALTRSGSNFTIFVDGVIAGSAVFSGTRADIGVDTTIGNYLNSSNNFPASLGSDLNAFISNLRIIKGISLYNGNFVPPIVPLPNTPETSLLLFQQSNILKDYSNNNQSIAILGNPTAISPETSFVPFWLDKSSNALTASQPIVNNQSTLLSAEVNGLDVLGFDGVNDYYNLSSPISLSGNYSHFFVYRRPTLNTVSQSLGRSDNNDNSVFLHWNGDFGSANFIYTGNRLTTSPVLSTKTLVGGLRKNEYLQIDRDSYSITSPWSYTPSFANSIGTYKFGWFHKDVMCEIIHTGSMLPNQEIDLVNKKLIDKWKVPKQVPYNKVPQTIFATSISALSTTLGTWAIEPTGFNVQWQRSNNNTAYTNIPNASSVIYSPTTADYGFFVRTSISASNSFGMSLPSFSNVLQLTTQNITPASLTRTTIFTVSATRGTWVSTMPLTYFYQYQVSAVNTFGWENFGTLTTSTTAYLSAYETTPVNVRTFEYAYNSTLGLPS